jgi:hypothetical protein
MHFEQVKVAINVLYQAQPLHHQVHSSYPAEVRGGGSLRHFVVDVTGFEHRAGLVFPVLGFKTTFDSLLAVAQNFRISSIHLKWPFVGCYSLGRTYASPHTDSHLQLLVQTSRQNRA